VSIGIEYAEEEFDGFGRIPGGFSPRNGDGVNDIFMKGVDELTIINRWGMVLFQSANKEGWDGRESKTKRMVEPGDYFYILKVYEYDNNKKPHTKTGVITVF
jgi:gliding motility-associated-like protein